MSNEQKGFKYRIGFHQSLSTGVIGFEGNANFDATTDDMFNSIHYLLENLKSAERKFKDAGYRLASDIEPKAKPVKNGKSDKEVES